MRRVGRTWTGWGRAGWALALLGTAVGCAASGGEDPGAPQARPLVAEAAPRPPHAVEGLLDLVDQTAAVVEGEVTDLRSEYSPRTGPWTVVTLEGVRAHLGRAPATLHLKQVGGPLPDGRQLVVSHVPRFVRGARYLVFLRNTGWSLSPVLDGQALRVEAVGGREVLVGPEGALVAGLGTAGVRWTAPVFDTVDLSGARPGRLARVDAAEIGRGLGPEAFVGLLQEHLRARGLSVSGTLREEPVSTASSLSVPVAPWAPVPSGVPAVGGDSLQPERDVPPGQP